MHQLFTVKILYLAISVMHLKRLYEHIYILLTSTITEQVHTLEILATDKTCIDIVCGESNRAELLKIEI